jgi:hypothetical protein
MNPQVPIYIPSKSRADTALTPRFFDFIGVPYRIVVEEQQHAAYRLYFPDDKLLVLDPAYQRDYDTCDDIGDDKSKGPGPARNFAWEHAISEGHAWHWVMDDNIKVFGRLHRNTRLRVGDGTIFRAMEDFCFRYDNVAMAGPNYWTFVTPRDPHPPFITGTRIYSCNLIRNDVQFRWRGRYNEDTILSLDMLKGDWMTVQFNAFLQHKVRTQTLGGGNTEAFYANEGTFPKSDMLVREHPDVARHAHRFGRDHHHVDYRQWLNKPLRRRKDYTAPQVDYKFRVEPTGLTSKRKDGNRFPVDVANG